MLHYYFAIACVATAIAILINCYKREQLRHRLEQVEETLDRRLFDVTPIIDRSAHDEVYHRRMMMLRSIREES